MATTTKGTENPLLAILGDEKLVQRVERAQRAARRAKEKHGSIQLYLRMITRDNQLRLEWTTGTPCTDGKTVWLRIPIAMGDDLPHDRKLCGERDPINRYMKCAACRSFDGVDCTMYHEASHITSESFMTLSDEEQAALVATAIRMEAKGLPESTRAKKLQRRIEAARPKTFVHASNLISPWLGVILNAVEDARVNEAMRAARPGTKLMFEAQSNEVFEEGIEGADGVMHFWREQPLGMQAVIGVYCAISGLPFDRWLHEDVVKALSDRRLSLLCFNARSARSVQTCFNLSIQILERLRELGFCTVEDEPEDDEPDPGEGDPSDDESTEESDEEQEGSGGGSPDPDSAEDDEESAEDDGEGENDGEDDSEDDSEGAGSGAGTDAEESSKPDPKSGTEDDGDQDAEGDLENPEYRDGGAEHAPERTSPPPPMGTPEEAAKGLQKFGRHDGDSVADDTTYEEREEIERAMVQGDHFDAPSVNIGGVKVHTDLGNGPGWNSYRRGDGDTIVIPETVLGPALQQMRRAFANNQRGSYERDRKSGAVDPARVGKRLLTEDFRWFREKRNPGKKDYFVLIGLDISGSTSRPGVLQLIKEAGFAQAALCQRMGIKFAVYAHTGESGDLAIYQIKSPRQVWDKAAQERLAKLSYSSANLDGHTLEFYRKVLDDQPQSDKLIMYYTDGAMPAENYAEELAILQREIDICGRKGYGLVGVGIRNDDPTKHGLDTIRIDHIEDVPKVVAGLRDRLLKR